MHDVEVILERGRDGPSRRTFIKGVIAAGAGAYASGYLFRATDVLAQAPSARGAVETLITINVNGQQRRAQVLKQETLAMTLRYQLGLTGTKLGCDRAECGACTVLVDGVTGAARPQGGWGWSVWTGQRPLRHGLRPTPRRRRRPRGLDPIHRRRCP